MDGGGLDGRRARHLFCRSLGSIGQGFRILGRLNVSSGVSLTSALTLTGQRFFFGSAAFADRRLRSVLNTTYLRAFYIFFMPRLLEW
jgi:hypothetical protein